MTTRDNSTVQFKQSFVSFKLPSIPDNDLEDVFSSCIHFRFSALEFLAFSSSEKFPNLSCSNLSCSTLTLFFCRFLLYFYCLCLLHSPVTGPRMLLETVILSYHEGHPTPDSQPRCQLTLPVPPPVPSSSAPPPLECLAGQHAASQHPALNEKAF